MIVLNLSFERNELLMTKDSDKRRKDEETEDDTEEMLQDQYEFGLHEDVREEIEEEDDDHKEPKDKADKDDEVINEDEVNDD